MARVKGGLNAKKKHNRVLKLAKGYRGAEAVLLGLEPEVEPEEVGFGVLVGTGEGVAGAT